MTMNKKTRMARLSTLMLVGLMAMPMVASAQKAGQSISVQYGKVAGVDQIDLRSEAPRGALVGGSIGLATTSSSKSSSKRARNALIGATAGGLIAGRSQGSTMGRVYTVNTGAGGEIKVVTDQLEIRNGDCVAVEKAGDTANIRRVSSAYCDKANNAAVKAVESESRQEAEECLMAKQQLVDAKDADEADLAARKIKLLCND